MLKTIIEKKRYCFYNSFDNWEDAIISSCKPLLEEKVIEEIYVKNILENVKKFGPYILIAPNICIPHAQENIGVNKTAISLMVVNKPVDFGEETPYKAKIFFVISSNNKEEHIENLKNLMKILMNENYIEDLMKSRCKEDLEKILEKYENKKEEYYE